MLEVPGGLALNPAAAALPASSQAGLQSSAPLGPPASLRLLPSGVLRQGDTEHLGAPGGGGGHWQRGWADQPRALEPRASPCWTSCHLLRGERALRSLVRVAELALSTRRPAITITLIEQTVPRLPHAKHWKGPETLQGTIQMPSCSCGTCMGRRGTHGKRRINTYAARHLLVARALKECRN